MKESAGSTTAVLVIVPTFMIGQSVTSDEPAYSEFQTSCVCFGTESQTPADQTAHVHSGETGQKHEDKRENQIKYVIFLF